MSKSLNKLSSPLLVLTACATLNSCSSLRELAPKPTQKIPDPILPSSHMEVLHPKEGDLLSITVVKFTDSIKPLISSD